MSQTIAIDDLPQSPAADTADEWSARRRLACLVALSVVSWVVILAPLVIWA